MKTFKILFLFLICLLSLHSTWAQWQTIASNTDIRTSIFFLDNNNGIGTNTTDILRTSDGGFTWLNLSQQTGTTFGGDDISFADGNNGIILKDNTSSISGTDYYFTTDSGQTWQNAWTTFDEYVNQIQFTSDSIGYVLSATGIKPGEIYKSTNGGTSWNLLYMASGSSTWFSDFEFINDSIGLIGGFVQDTIPMIFLSNNGGLIWDSLPVNLNMHPPFVIDMLNQTTGYLISTLSGTINKSTDGFNTWNPVYSNVSLWLKDIHFPSIDTGYFVAYDTTLAVDVIYRTVNAGASWTKQTFAGFAVTAMYFLNGKKGWVCGNNGNIAALGIATSSSDIPHNKCVLNIYPNPFDQVAVVQFNNPASQVFAMAIYTLQGRLVRTLTNITTEQVKIKKGNLADGMYFFKLQADNANTFYTGKFTIR